MATQRDERCATINRLICERFESGRISGTWSFCPWIFSPTNHHEQKEE